MKTEKLVSMADDIYEAICRIDMLDSTWEEMEATVFPLLCEYAGHKGDEGDAEGGCPRCHRKGT